MIAAHKSGINVFVTGGIGGVHRGAQTSMYSLYCVPCLCVCLFACFCSPFIYRLKSIFRGDMGICGVGLLNIFWCGVSLNKIKNLQC